MDGRMEATSDERGRAAAVDPDLLAGQWGGRRAHARTACRRAQHPNGPTPSWGSAQPRQAKSASARAGQTGGKARGDADAVGGNRRAALTFAARLQMSAAGRGR